MEIKNDKNSDSAKFLYKYRPIDTTKKIQENYSIISLENNEISFSSRKNFNDVFDSKIEISTPTPNDLKNLIKRLPKREKNHISKLMKDGKITNQGHKKIQETIKKYNETIDTYAILSLSGNPNNNLMWSHYANSHKGFCIELDVSILGEFRKISYEKDTPKLPLIDMVENTLTNKGEEEMAEKIVRFLHQKLDYWKYEDEYRIILRGNIKSKKDFILKKYPPEALTAIIFGCRSNNETINYISTIAPKHTKLKKCVEKSSSLEIEDI